MEPALNKAIKSLPKKYERSGDVKESIATIVELSKEWGQHPMLIKAQYRLRRIYFDLRESEGYN